MLSITTTFLMPPMILILIGGYGSIIAFAIRIFRKIVMLVSSGASDPSNSPLTYLVGISGIIGAILKFTIPIMINMSSGISEAPELSNQWNALPKEEQIYLKGILTDFISDTCPSSARFDTNQIHIRN